MSGAVKARSRYEDVGEAKAEGVTYTPRVLAEFVADRIVANRREAPDGPLRVLDPAVGHGELLLALLDRLNEPVIVNGFETDPNALAEAQRRISSEHPTATLNLQHGSFLDHVIQDFSGGLFDGTEPYDLIIANPPYVRTQIIGAQKAGRLAAEFGLSGRVDLYHAFLLGMTKVLAPVGTAGFIVSNRFMTTKSGSAIRTSMADHLQLREIYDLGDTKVFDAAVLPAVLIANGDATGSSKPEFHSIYETKSPGAVVTDNPILALGFDGLVSVKDGRSFHVRHGTLDHGKDGTDVWRLASEDVQDWLDTVADRTWGTFRDIGKIRVGIKTCADKVFLPKTWDQELELHQTLTTHHTARRFRPMPPNRKVLYPHQSVTGRKQPVDLDLYPDSRAYLENHREVLEARTYVIEAGRRWYEIWVPQNPEDWEAPKLVFRDISEKPTFWMDLDGTVVNGDCYWLKGDENLLWLALGVANSSFIETFYDMRFNNKLYAGRRRFITQYVEQFPLPDPQSGVGQEIISCCRKLYERIEDCEAPELEKRIDELVYEAFGLPVKKI